MEKLNSQTTDLDLRSFFYGTAKSASFIELWLKKLIKKYNLNIYQPEFSVEFSFPTCEKITYPNQKFSKSHSGEYQIILYINEFKGVGVDIEKKKELNERLRIKLLSEQEINNKLLDNFSTLELWCIKEALFKANIENQDTLVKNYFLENNHEATYKSMKFEYLVQNFEEYLLSICVRVI